MTALPGTDRAASGPADPAAVLEQMLTLLPAREHAPLTLDAGSSAVPATVITDPDWVAGEMALRARRWSVDDPLILGTVLWRTYSNALVLPAIASAFLTGSGLSAAPAEVILHRRTVTGRDVDFTGPDRVSGLDGTTSGNRKMFGRLVGARATARACSTPAEELATGLAPGVRAMARVCGKGERRLWAIAVDSIANRYLWAGMATGRAAEAMDTARRVVAELTGLVGGPALPAPRFTEVEFPDLAAPIPFLRRVSCCLLYNGPHGVKCSTCPRQLPSERHARLGARGRRMIDDGHTPPPGDLRPAGATIDSIARTPHAERIRYRE